MVVPNVVVLRLVADWLLYKILANSCYRAAKNLRNYIGFFKKNPHSRSPSSSQHQQQHTDHQQQQQHALFPSVTKCDSQNREFDTLVCDMHGALLRPSSSSCHSFFPYFMLVSFEGGSILRAFCLLLSCVFLWVLGHEQKLRVMIFITFCGLKTKDMEAVSRAVLPKFYLENLNAHAFRVLASAGSRVVLTSVPRVMVEDFLKDYLRVDAVLGTELQTFGHYFTGLVSGPGLLVKHRALASHVGDRKPEIGLGTSTYHDQLFISQCKEAYVVNGNEPNSVLPREKYPKPLIFHDGRLAFLPTPLATLSMFLWLPVGVILAIFRLSVGIVLPHKLALLLGSMSGVDIRLKLNSSLSQSGGKSGARGGVLYVCSHRTLLDPVFLSTSLRKPLTAVTYSLSKMSEIIAPIRTVRLTRDRKRDGETMAKLLSEGDLVVCPEGTTCREPYLLRFSSLFAELADEIVPVAMNTNVTMFYGTTASGLKCLDPIFFLMNPRPRYHMQVLEKLPRELTCSGGARSSHEVANHIQRQLADALGFECTNFTRRDKYLMLAGNEGVVHDHTANKLKP